MHSLSFKKLFTTIGIFLAPTLACAIDIDNPDWQFDVAPYIWAINMDGTVTNGPFTSHISESFSELMKHFDGGGMLWLDAYKGRFGIFVNGLYTDLSDHDNIGKLDASVRTHFGIISGGISYVVLQKRLYNTENFHQIQLEPYIGARYTFNYVKLKLDDIHAQENPEWTDAIIGLRVRDDINIHWLVTLAGDLGGKDYRNQHSYNLVGLIGYKPTNPTFKNTTVYLGYRYLYQFYEQGHDLDFFQWDMKLFGPILGLNFNF